jgi:hypothetical protein
MRGVRKIGKRADAAAPLCCACGAGTSSQVRTKSDGFFEFDCLSHLRTTFVVVPAGRGGAPPHFSTNKTNNSPPTGRLRLRVHRTASYPGLARRSAAKPGEEWTIL